MVKVAGSPRAIGWGDISTSFTFTSYSLFSSTTKNQSQNQGFLGPRKKKSNFFFTILTKRLNMSQNRIEIDQKLTTREPITKSTTKRKPEWWFFFKKRTTVMDIGGGSNNRWNNEEKRNSEMKNHDPRHHWWESRKVRKISQLLDLMIKRQRGLRSCGTFLDSTYMTC